MTPRCDTASITAFTTAGGAAIVPASPMPFTPSGFVVDGVFWLSSETIVGISTAVGTRYCVIDDVSQVARVVVDRLLVERLGDALRDAAVHLSLDDHRVDDVPQSSTATYFTMSVWPVSVSTSTTQTCVPAGQVKFGGS